MTGPTPGGTERGTEAPSRTTGTQGTVGAVLIVLAAGLALRLILAYLLPGSGFSNDLGAFRAWSADLAVNGPGGFYDRAFFHDYTPGYLYALWFIGSLGKLVGWQTWDASLPFLTAFDLKVVPILADLAIGWLVWSMTLELGGARRVALFGAFIAVLNPISWFDSVVWGQVDSVGVVFLLLGLRELWRDRPERAAMWTVVAAIIKPQLGILVPIVAVVVIRRAFVSWGGHGRPDDGEGTDPVILGDRGADLRTRLRRWESRTDRPIRVVTTGLAGFAVAVLLCLPFDLSVVELRPEPPFVRSELVEQIGVAAGGYPYVTVNAYNPWALVTLDGQGLAENGLWILDRSSPTEPDDAFLALGPIPAVGVGSALLLAVIGLVLVLVWRDPDRQTLLVGLAVIALAFFVVPTRVHERYLYPFFALGAILAAVSIRWRAAYVFLSVATLANMYVVLTTIYPNNPSIDDWLRIGETIRSPQGVALFSIIHAVAFVWALLELRPAGRRALADDVADSGVQSDDDWGENDGELVQGRDVPTRDAAPAMVAADPERQARDRAAAAPARVAVDDGRSVRPVPSMPTWRPRPGLDQVGVLGWLRARLFERPVRPDRSAALVREAGGRFDRLDVWLLALIVVSALCLRTFRLAEPYQMHFDEVYHARTAAEFLQSWRYGDDHDIYEWTHPHLAKYAIAGGIVAWGDDRVSATSELGLPVVDAVSEPRRPDPLRPGGTAGERLLVATGDSVVAYDLRTRERQVTLTIPGARALAIDHDANELIVGTTGGALLAVDLSLLDAVGDGTAIEPVPIATLPAQITRIHVTDDGMSILAATDGKLTAVDSATGTLSAPVSLPGLVDIASAGRGPAVVATPADVPDVAATTERLTDFLDADATALAARLTDGPTALDGTVVLGGLAGGTTRKDLETAITAGELPGIAIAELPRAAAATSDGVTFIDPATGSVLSSFPLDGGAHGLAAASAVDGLYVSSGTSDQPTYTVITISGDGAKDGPVLGSTNPLPGLGSRVVYDDPSQQVHILGRTVDGEAATVYVIEPHGNAVYADARLPFDPVAWALDVNAQYPSSDRQQLLAFSADGGAASVEIGKHAFAWRMPGVIAGALTAGLLYLLTRILFRRRSVALLAGLFVLVDGMFFVQSRIAMNDVYVGLFIIAAYTLFAALWTGRWRHRLAFWLGMPAMGLLLGLALSSKWVAAYAIGAVGLLILARSALGRLVLIAGMIGVTTVLGYMAISVPADQGIGNLTFLLIMIGLTLVSVVVTVLHPIAWSNDEVRFALGAPAALGSLVFLGAVATGRIGTTYTLGGLSIRPIEVAVALALGSLVVYGLFRLAAGWGMGPLAAKSLPDDPIGLLEPAARPADGWLRPGWLLGLPVAWMTISLVALPVAVYVVSYIPWALIENHRIVDGLPAGATGQTLAELTGQMYRYHNTLTSAHAASSPWWAWPFDLKPVWFYQEGFAGNTSAALYDAGNLVIWWLGVPAMAWVALMAFRRRNLGLALVAIGFTAQWISWARIDRAAFQYHYYTALPFVVMGLAYFVAELWHGATRHTWLLARAAAAAAVVAPAILHLLSRPLCGFVGVESVNPGSQACPALIPEFVLTARSAGLAGVLGLGILFVVRGFLGLDRPGARRRGFGPLLVTAGVAGAGLVLTTFLPDTSLLTLTNVPVEPIALVIALPLGYLALQVLGARDARRFVAGLLVAIVAAFAIFYPNIAALPLPSTIVNAYQGLIPTYLYAFQFPVSTIDRNVETALFTPMLLGLLGALILTSIVVGYSAWTWRITLAARDVVDDDADQAGAFAG